MTTDAAQRFIERAEAQRDLKGHMEGMMPDEEQEIQAYEWSPGRKLARIWNMETGESIWLPRYQAVAAIYQPSERSSTGYLWTANEELAPPARVNNTKCFLHPDSPERALLDEIGVAVTCMSAHLANESSKWAHARNRHPSAYNAYQTEVGRRENDSYRAEQRRQTDAILQLAGARTEPVQAPTPEPLPPEPGPLPEPAAEPWWEQHTKRQIRGMLEEKGITMPDFKFQTTNKEKLARMLEGTG